MPLLYDELVDVAALLLEPFDQLRYGGLQQVALSGHRARPYLPSCELCEGAVGGEDHVQLLLFSELPPCLK